MSGPATILKGDFRSAWWLLVEGQQPLMIAEDEGADDDPRPLICICTASIALDLFVTGPIALGLLHWACLHWAGMSLGRDRVRQVRNPGTRKHRDANGHDEVDRVADHVAVVQPSAVLPSNASGLSACLAAGLIRRRPAQRAEISCRPGAVIAHRVPGYDQGSTAQGHDEADDASHEDRRAARLRTQGSPRTHAGSPADGSGTTCARASSGTEASQRPKG
jgi:hypothetical protein